MASESQAPQQPGNTKLAEGRILIVDDNATLLSLLATQLEKLGYEIESFSDPRAALERLRQGTLPDLCLFDIMMPHLNGFDLLAAALELPGFRHIPVIFLSAKGDDKDRIFALSHGAVDFITKPCYMRELFARIDVHVRLRRQEKELTRFSDLLETELASRTKKLTEAQAQLYIAGKMASLGQLAAGISHEINNPMSFVYSNLSTLQRYARIMHEALQLYRSAVDPGSETGERIRRWEEENKIDRILQDCDALIEESLEGAKRIRHIVENMKSFAHPGKGDLEKIDINQMLQETVRIAWNEIKYNAELVEDYGELPRVPGYPQELRQVFLNLVVNAAQALTEHGEIRLQTRVEDDMAVIRIADTGCGIPPENLARIYDPFFTTKEVGKGTGLGLPLCHSIVDKHGGRIEVESAVGAGSTFTVRLPLEGGRS